MIYAKVLINKMKKGIFNSSSIFTLFNFKLNLTMLYLCFFIKLETKIGCKLKVLKKQVKVIFLKLLEVKNPSFLNYARVVFDTKRGTFSKTNKVFFVGHY